MVKVLSVLQQEGQKAAAAAAWRNMHVRFKSSEGQFLDHRAEREGVSRSALIRRGVREKMTADGT